MLYAATLTNDPAKQEAIYTQATKQFPNDYRAYNNLGKLAYQAGNVDKAESYLKKAASVNAAPEVNMNLGLISLIKGDKAAAEAYFGKAAGTKELGESMVTCTSLKASTKEQLTHSVTLRLTVLLWLRSLLRTTTKLKTHWQA